MSLQTIVLPNGIPIHLALLTKVTNASHLKATLSELQDIVFINAAAVRLKSHSGPLTLNPIVLELDHPPPSVRGGFFGQDPTTGYWH